jgi:CDP-diacylglycerol--glycerol-3-phosphate 3-phosphatidyltransferase
VAYWANVITMTAAVALTIISGVDYVVAFMRAKRVRS